MTTVLAPDESSEAMLCLEMSSDVEIICGNQQEVSGLNVLHLSFALIVVVIQKLDI